MATINILGVPHFYELTAPTPSTQTLVFIHGWLLSHGYWQPVIDQLAPVHQCLSYDLRGFGASQAKTQKQSEAALLQSDSDSKYAPAAYAQDLTHLLQHLDIQNAWLIGHSLGGTIALWGAAQSPERVRGVICLNAGGGIYLKEEFERFRVAGQQILKLRPQWLCYLPLLDLLFTRA
ncbi:MAG: alpha/beta hydrolase, partial [Leptolyngbyaceae bacterium]|nr:alpha/beta hydrolase [Leptolyngbyaceae bacterium]